MTKESLKHDFLNKHIFQGLINLNDGFDSKTIKYFSESDFRIVLDRVEKMQIGIYGIEPWLNGHYFDIAVSQDYTIDPTDPTWYRQAFEEFVSKSEHLQYSASYHVPQLENLTL